MQTQASFPAPWSGELRLLTVVTTVVLLGSSIALAPVDFPPGPWKAMALSFGPATILIASLFRVQGYQIAGTDLIVLRPGWQTRISLAGLTRIEASDTLIRSSLRLFGNGGAFSFTGVYWSSQLGRYRLFANDTRRAVVLWLPHRRVVVAPDDPSAFVQAVRGQAPIHG